jgi:membrane-bound ClpP family serine protease
MSPLVWILMLIGTGLSLILLEVFVPSGGVLGLLAVVALGAGVVTAFVEQGALLGMGVLAGTFLAVPAVLGAAFRWFPATPLGRRVLPPPPAAEEVLPDVAERHRLRELVGRAGRTTSDLLPWGSVAVDGVTCDAVSEGGPIGQDVAVEAVAVQGRAVVVRPVAATAALPTHATASPPAAAAPAATEPPAAAGLSSVLEEFDFDEIRQNEPSARPLDSPPSANKP